MGAKLSDMKIARTTVREQIYVADQILGQTTPEVTKIHDANRSENKRLMDKSIKIQLTAVDINSAMNTSDETKILDTIIAGIKANDLIGVTTKLLVVLNKCDEMDSSGNLVDEELQSMEKQARSIITESISKASCPGFIGFVKLSAEDAYIYKMCKMKRFDILDQKHIDKAGINIYGKPRWLKKASSEKLKIILHNLINKWKSFAVSPQTPDLDRHKYFIYALRRLENALRSGKLGLCSEDALIYLSEFARVILRQISPTLQQFPDLADFRKKIPGSALLNLLSLE